MLRSVDLEGSASVDGPGREMRSDRIQVKMDEQNRITDMVGTGNASLVPESGRLFTGNQIVIKAQPAQKRLTQFEVTGAAGRRAIYTERGAQGASVIEGDRIVGDSRTGPPGRERRIGTLRGGGFRCLSLGAARYSSGDIRTGRSEDSRRAGRKSSALTWPAAFPCFAGPWIGEG